MSVSATQKLEMNSNSLQQERGSNSSLVTAKIGSLNNGGAYTLNVDLNVKAERRNLSFQRQGRNRKPRDQRSMCLVEEECSSD